MRDNELDTPSPRGATDVLGMLSDVHARLKKVEADNAEMRAQIDGAKKSGDLNFNFAHAAHVLDKHFYHDQPVAEKAPPPSPKFDAFTGDRLQ
jgi:hypothetical protein